jgi:RHS repeat-associated protein
LGLNYYAYGARNYDPTLEHWMNIDALAEKSRRFSPYTFALNNPVYFIKLDGMENLGQNNNR